MKYVIRDQHKDITSPHTNKKYTSTVSPWYKREIINTYFMLLDHDNLLPEGEVLFVQFERDTVDFKQD